MTHGIGRDYVTGAEAELYQLQRRVDKACLLLREGVTIDGGHHKQWYLEQVADALGIRLGAHEEGIAP